MEEGISKSDPYRNTLTPVIDFPTLRVLNWFVCCIEEKFTFSGSSKEYHSLHLIAVSPQEEQVENLRRNVLQPFIDLWYHTAQDSA